MIAFAQSASAKGATQNSRSAVTPVRTGIIIEQPYGANLYEELFERRLCAIEARDHTFLSDVWSVGRRVFGKAKKLLAKRNQTHPVSPVDESFCSPGSLDDEDEEMEIPVNLILRRPRVRNRRNVCTKAPCDVQGMYIADAEGSYESGYEYQRPCDIIEEIEEGGEDGEDLGGDGDITVRIDTRAIDDTPDLELECSNPTAVVKLSNTWATSFPVSPFFCLPARESTLVPSTPSVNGPSTPRSMPVLVYESDSYEDALYAEFNAIIDKVANKTRRVA